MAFGRRGAQQQPANDPAPARAAPPPVQPKPAPPAAAAPAPQSAAPIEPAAAEPAPAPEGLSAVKASAKEKGKLGKAAKPAEKPAVKSPQAVAATAAASQRLAEIQGLALNDLPAGGGRGAGGKG